MAAHDLRDRRLVWRTACASGQHVADLLEVGRAEDARRRDREELRVDAATILEPVDLTATNAHRLAGRDLTGLAVDRPRADPLEAVDRLLEAVVAMGHGYPGIGRNVALEDRDAAAGIVSLNEEVDLDRADLDRSGR